MSADNHPLIVLGQSIRTIEDSVLPQIDRLAELKRDISFVYPIKTNNSRQAKNHKNTIFWSIAASAAAAAAVLLIMFSQVKLTVSLDGVAVTEGAFISGNIFQKTELDFSDGSQIELKPKSKIRIRTLNADGAHLLLERGRIDANIINKKKSNWQIDVGPYCISVTGTKFSVKWEPATDDFRLEMIEGSVIVTGPLSEKEKVLRTGESLHITSALKNKTKQQDSILDTGFQDTDFLGTDFREEENRNGKETEIEDIFSNDIPPSDLQNLPTSRLKSSVTVQQHDSLSDWRYASESGKYAEALTLAKQAGFEKILKNSSASELVALGDTARHAGDLKSAESAYKTVRKRFPKSVHSSNAAFLLGVTEFNKTDSYLEAAKWFKIVALEQSTKAGLSKEAAGRLIESLKLGGDLEGAKKAAQSYLSKYPDGPHQKQAAQLLN